MNAVVTGANRGIGLELCRQLSQNNDLYQSIYALCRNTSKELTALSEKSSKVSIVENIDVTDNNVVNTKLQSIFHSNEDDGNSKQNIIPINLLIHNAGAYGPPEQFPTSKDMYKSQSLENITPERMMYSFQLNALAPLFLTKALLPNLRAAAAAVAATNNESATATKVIIISSLMGSMADNTSGGHYGYRTAKAAVNMIGKSLACDLASDAIAVGMIHPGYVFTGFGQDNIRREGQRNVDESTRGVLQAIEQINMESTGSFLHGNYGEGVRSLNW